MTWIVEKKHKVRFSIDLIRGVKSNYRHSLEIPEMDM